MTTATSRPLGTTRRLRSVTIAGPAGRLEAVVNEGSPGAPFAALVCHPHPLGGGTMHNKVVYHAMKVMNAAEWGLRWPVLRFNFRGTGLSEGKHDGTAETGDVAAALGWLENEYNRPVVVAGFSFGAAMALGACCGGCSSDVRAIAAIGLPIRTRTHTYDYSFLSSCAIRKLFLSGDRDQFAAKAELVQAIASAPEPKTIAMVPGADHFFHGQLEQMQCALSDWLKELA